VDGRGRGGLLYTGRPEMILLLMFPSPHQSVTAPPLHHGRPDDCNIFLRAIRFGHLWKGRGGCVFQTDHVEQEAGSKKSVFVRTSLMDDPLDVLLFYYTNLQLCGRHSRTSSHLKEISHQLFLNFNNRFTLPPERRVEEDQTQN